MNQDQLQNEIHSKLTHGETVEQIYSHYLQQGVQVAQIQEALQNLNPSTNNARHSTPEKQRVNIIQIVTYTGAVLIALGVFSFVAANWQEMDRATKILLLITCTAVSNGAAILAHQRDLHKTAAALFILGSCIYGASVFLVGQIFNIRGNWADGFFWWMLGVLPLAYITGISALWGIVVLTGLIGASGYPFAFNQTWVVVDPLMFTSLPLLLTAIIIPLLLSLKFRKRVVAKYPELF